MRGGWWVYLNSVTDAAVTRAMSLSAVNLSNCTIHSRPRLKFTLTYLLKLVKVTMETRGYQCKFCGSMVSGFRTYIFFCEDMAQMS